MTDKIAAFVARWSSSGGEERANKDSFLNELCDALDLPRPEPKTGDDRRDLYVFEKDVVVSHELGRRSTRKIDLYRQGSFLLEAKQGSNKGAKKLGTAKRDTPGWHQAMNDAYGQALGYVSFLDQPPPFLIACDLGYCFDLYADFDGSRRYNPFPSAQRKRLYFKDLAKHLDLLRTLFLDPLSLDPAKKAAEATREIAETLAELARRLEAAGHDQGLIARFLMRCLFTMFAEDVGLLPDHVFTRALKEHWIPSPASFPGGIQHLWQTMNDGGMFGLVGKLLRFNGGLFADTTALPLDLEALHVLRAAAERDWSHVEPAIFGTLLERALDPKERHRLGAHYTPRSYVERLVRPTIEEPLRADWNVVQAHVRQLVTESASAKPAQAEKLRKQAVKEVKDFHRSLCNLRVLDPACGTGNFLYVTMDLFRRIENEVLVQLDALGERGGLLSLEGIRVTPAQFLGIEIKQWAKEIAELVLWIGFLQGQLRSLPPRKKGEAPPVPEPVLQDYKNIECRDAILAYDGEPILVRDENGKPVTRWDGETYKRDPLTKREVPDEKAQQVLYSYKNPRQSSWPKADFIIGNPPFVGNKRMRRLLGVGYSETLRNVYGDVPESVDLVMYWWQRAAVSCRNSLVRRFGFITTSKITQSYNSRVVEENMASDGGLVLAFAIPDHPWSDEEDAAAVRIAMTVASVEAGTGTLESVTEEDISGDEPEISFRKTTGVIHADLSIGPDVRSALPLKSNQGLSFMGVTLEGNGFVLSQEEVDKRGLGGCAHLYPYIIGRDLNRTMQKKYVIDLFDMTDLEAEQSEPLLYNHVLEHVRPAREAKASSSKDYIGYAKKWWIFAKPRPGMRQALSGLNRFIATCRTATHRVFSWVHPPTRVESTIVVVALDDSFSLGVLSSRVHSVWALRAGSRLGVGNDPRYNNSKCFEQFPFPEANLELRQHIAGLADRIESHRKRVLSAEPSLIVTEMYNVLEKLRRGEALVKKEPEVHQKGLISTLKKIHDDLDAAVFEAYGWPATLTDEEILERLVALNAERAEEERQGKVRWLRPEYQNPQGSKTAHQTSVPTEEVEEAEEEGAVAAKKPAWPSKVRERIVALRDLLTRHDQGWTVAQAAAAFKGAKKDEVEEILESLEALGTLVAYVPEGLERHWRRSVAQPGEPPSVAARRASVAPPRNSPAQALADELRGLRSEAHQRQASDRSVAALDEWMRHERWSDVEELLRTLDPTQLHPAATLAILAVTHPARERLTERDVFVARAEATLPEQLGAERAERLLAPCR